MFVKKKKQNIFRLSIWTAWVQKTLEWQKKLLEPPPNTSLDCFSCSCIQYIFYFSHSKLLSLPWRYCGPFQFKWEFEQQLPISRMLCLCPHVLLTHSCTSFHEVINMKKTSRGLGAEQGLSKYMAVKEETIDVANWKGDLCLINGLCYNISL